MPVEKKSLTIDPGIELDSETLRKFLGHYALPGEVVRSTNARFMGESDADAAARRARAGEGPFTVKETRVHAHNGDDNSVMVSYLFEGVEGLHNAKAFGDDGEPIHGTGVLLGSSGSMWFVPTEMVEDATVAVDAPIQIEPSLPRSARYAFAVADETLSIPEDQAGYVNDEAFVAAMESEPLSGEFSMSRRSDGSVVLVYQSWTVDASEAERDVAKTAIGTAGPRP